jgi:hypothetical protein
LRSRGNLGEHSGRRGQSAASHQVFDGVTGALGIRIPPFVVSPSGASTTSCQIRLPAGVAVTITLPPLDIQPRRAIRFAEVGDVMIPQPRNRRDRVCA